MAVAEAMGSCFRGDTQRKPARLDLPPPHAATFAQLEHDVHDSKCGVHIMDANDVLMLHATQQFDL